MLVNRLGGDAEKSGDLAYRVTLFDEVDNLFSGGGWHRWVTLAYLPYGCQRPNGVTRVGVVNHQMWVYCEGLHPLKPG